MTLEPGAFYARNADATAVTVAGAVLFFRPGMDAWRASVADPGAVAVLWEELAQPRRGAELEAQLRAGPADLGTLLDALVERALVLRGPASDVSPEVAAGASAGKPCGRLVVGVTGAVQAVFTPSLVRRLAGEFARHVDVVLTGSAQQFVVPRALTVLGADVWTDTFETRQGVPVAHAHLAAADMVVVVPASADALARLANGAAADLLSLVVLATTSPVVVVPSMNEAMWCHPAVRRNVATLRGDGVYVVEPGPGWQVADGDAGRQVGGAGLGAGGANLTALLAAVLRLSTPRSLRPSPRPPAS